MGSRTVKLLRFLIEVESDRPVSGTIVQIRFNQMKACISLPWKLVFITDGLGLSSHMMLLGS